MVFRSLAVSVLLSLPIVALASPVASVNGQVITSEQLQAADPTLASDPAGRQQAIQILLSRALLAQEAEKSGIKKEKSYQISLGLYRMQLLATKAAEQYWEKHPVTEDEILSAYSELKKRYPVTEYRFRDILVKDRAQAESCLRELKKGASFSILASRYSDGDNASIGGESGWIPESRVPAVFLSVLRDSGDGVVTGPIAVPSGWAVVQMLEKRAVHAPTLAAEREKIVQSIKNKQIEEYVQTLRKHSFIKIFPLKDGGGSSHG